jgi:uncharacterized protein YjbJ (UPF0337 family)
MWNQNERDGKVDQAKGRVKQAVGDVTGNDKLKAEGEVDETVGKAKAAVGGAQKKLGAAIVNAGKAVKRQPRLATVGRPEASSSDNRSAR